MWFSCVIYDTDLAIGYTLFADIIAIVYPLIILFQKYNIFISKDSLLFWKKKSNFYPFIFFNWEIEWERECEWVTLSVTVYEWE